MHTVTIVTERSAVSWEWELGQAMMEGEKGITRGQKETSEVMYMFIILIGGDSFLEVYICQNLSNFTF